MTYIDKIEKWVCNALQEHFGLTDGQIKGHYDKGTWRIYRYIQIYLTGMDQDIHYEYRVDKNWHGRVELHFEGNWEERYSSLVDSLMDMTQNSEDLVWNEWEYGYRCQHVRNVDTLEELFDTLSYMMSVFEKGISRSSSNQLTRENIILERNDSLGTQMDTVDIHLMNLRAVLMLPLSIPDYQRIYCWEETNVKCLLDDLVDHFGRADATQTPYRLGTIILHSHDNKYDIIDGQQRLVTLSLLLAEMGVIANLMSEKFSSKRSVEYVAYNKHLIKEYVRKHLSIHKNINHILDSLEFSVLVLKNASIDLAYTFFSNQNSRGVDLTDYDLLKAHHLRYIPGAFEQQAMRAAEVWNQMIEHGRVDTDQTTDPDYVRTLDTYIYRLRKWIRKKECDDGQDSYRVKREYEAAPIVEEIPPFGEKFYFDEPIQGGSHFFSFVEQHINKYHHFTETKEYKVLHNSIYGGSHQWYRDVVESILFGYYLKFDNYYLADALAVIMRIVFQHRYINGRAKKSSIVQYAGDTELVMIINQSTSPTFFLAEARNIAKEYSYPERQKMAPIMRSLRIKASNVSKKIESRIVVESFKNLNK